MENIKILLVLPGEAPEVVSIENTLAAKQKLVGEWIEVIYPDDNVAFVCNEEGKLIGLPLNRAIMNGDDVIDIIAGTFFICGVDEENFTSLNEEQIKKYTELFKYPEAFFRDMDNKIRVKKIK